MENKVEKSKNSAATSVPCSNTTSSQQVKTWSDVWLHFTKNELRDKGICHYCDREISCRTKDGSTTGALDNHLKRCKELRNIEEGDKKEESKKKKQATIYFSEDESGMQAPTLYMFNQENCRKALARMIIKDELPFRHVEREGFIEYSKMLQPRFMIPSRRTVARDCINLYGEEKDGMKLFFKKFCNRVSLTIDTCTSSQNLNYMCLTAHFIDDDWKLHKRIISFCQIHSHTGEVIGRMVEKCLLAWGIENIFTITVDNASSNDVDVQYLKRRLNSWGGCILNGEYLHMRCAAHILSLVVKDGLKDLNDSIVRIRKAVRYIRGSAARLQRFKACVKQQKINSKCLISLDVETRWNSTYLMLENAVKFEKAFDLLEIQDGKFRSELGVDLPMPEDWSYARGILPFLKIFYEATLKLLGSSYVTGNVYMEEIFDAGVIIHAYSEHEDESVRLMAHKMKIKFAKYWGNTDNMNLMIFIATILDPRHKRDYVKWVVERVYFDMDATRLMEKIDNLLESMFETYKSLSGSTNVVSSDGSKEQAMVNMKKLDKGGLRPMYMREKASESSSDLKSELQRYLMEECEDTNDLNFDILLWWKAMSIKYKILSLMARDLLAMLVSTVASESAFSAGGRVLDSFRSSLLPRMVEALICTQDWIRKDNEPLIVDEELEEIESMEFEFPIENEDGIFMNLDD